MRFAIADPPYPGQAAKHYGCREVNHEWLIRDLVDTFPDGWVLCTSSPSLRQLLPMCPEDVRVGAWVKPFASFKPGVNPAYAWEPVIFRGGRKRGRGEPTVRDYVSENITLKRGVSGAKPEAFSWWCFDLLGAEPGDEVIDLFHGSGAVVRAWEAYANSRLFAGVLHDRPRPGTGLFADHTDTRDADGSGDGNRSPAHVRRREDRRGVPQGAERGAVEAAILQVVTNDAEAV